MKQPFTNDFGAVVAKEKVRAALLAAGWHKNPEYNFWVDPAGNMHTLRNAWYQHKKGTK